MKPFHFMRHSFFIKKMFEIEINFHSFHCGPAKKHNSCVDTCAVLLLLPLHSSRMALVISRRRRSPTQHKPLRGFIEVSQSGKLMGDKFIHVAAPRSSLTVRTIPRAHFFQLIKSSKRAAFANKSPSISH
jgi:hypothetical protein